MFYFWVVLLSRWLGVQARMHECVPVGLCLSANPHVPCFNDSFTCSKPTISSPAGKGQCWNMELLSLLCFVSTLLSHTGAFGARGISRPISPKQSVSRRHFQGVGVRGPWKTKTTAGVDPIPTAQESPICLINTLVLLGVSVCGTLENIYIKVSNAQ